MGFVVSPVPRARDTVERCRLQGNRRDDHRRNPCCARSGLLKTDHPNDTKLAFASVVKRWKEEKMMQRSRDSISRCIATLHHGASSTNHETHRLNGHAVRPLSYIYKIVCSYCHDLMLYHQKLILPIHDTASEECSSLPIRCLLYRMKRRPSNSGGW